MDGVVLPPRWVRCLCLRSRIAAHRAALSTALRSGAEALSEWTPQRNGVLVDFAQDSSQDDLSLPPARDAFSPPFDPSTARKPRAAFDLEPYHGDARCLGDLGAGC